jgi:hypothetical protein
MIFSARNTRCFACGHCVQPGDVIDEIVLKDNLRVWEWFCDRCGVWNKVVVFADSDLALIKETDYGCEEGVPSAVREDI